MSFYGKYNGMGGGSGGGVSSLDGLTGALTLVAGSGISIVDGTNTITISSTSSGDVTLTPVGSSPNADGASLSGQALTLQPANTSFPGVLLAADWNTFNNKQSALTLTNLTDVGTDGITITNGTGAVIGASPVTISQQVSDASHNGYLSSTDWSTFNSKQPAFTSQPQNEVFASPDGSAGVPSFRALVAADIPSLSGIYLPLTGGTMSGAIAMGNNKITGLTSGTTTGDALQWGQIGAANGIAGLDGGGKVPFSQLPSTLMIYLGAWDASTNTPTLADGTGTNGDVYRVSVAGTQNLGSGSQTFFVGDFVIYNGSIWQRSPAADGVVSVNGMTGAVVLTQGNLTDAGTDGITVTNGTNAVWGTGTSLSQHVADTTHNGYLSSTDWNTFNSKQPALTLTNLTDVGTDGITITNGTGAVVGSSPVTLSQHVADTTHNGYLSSTDWNTFNGKQSALTFTSPLVNTTGTVSLQGATGTAFVGSGGTGATTLAYTDAATASTIVSRDASGNSSFNQVTSTVATGTAPFVVSSTTLVANLHAATANAATNATNVATTATNSTNATFFPTFVGSSSSGNQGIDTATGLTFNPSTNALTTTTFVGALTGTASGNTTYTPNNHGVVISGSGNTMTVIAPDASTTKVLTSGGTGADPTWSPIPSPLFNYVARTTAYNAVAGDYVNCTSGTFAVTLPTAVSIAGQSIKIKNSGTGVITINTTSSQTVDGLASAKIIMGTQYDEITVTSDGANWTVENWNIVVVGTATASGQTPQTLNGTTAWTISAVNDPQSAFNSTTYTVPYPGYYHISVMFDMGVTTTGSANNLLQAYVMKGASAVITGATRSQASVTLNDFQIMAVGTLKLATSDAITFNLNTNFGTPGTTGAAVISITKMRG